MNPSLRRPDWSSTYSICVKCKSRALLPRQAGNICRKCNREIQEKVIIDKQTKALMKRFKTQQRFKY